MESADGLLESCWWGLVLAFHLYPPALATDRIFRTLDFHWYNLRFMHVILEILFFVSVL